MCKLLGGYVILWRLGIGGGLKAMQMKRSVGKQDGTYGELFGQTDGPQNERSGRRKQGRLATERSRVRRDSPRKALARYLVCGRLAVSGTKILVPAEGESLTRESLQRANWGKGRFKLNVASSPKERRGEACCFKYDGTCETEAVIFDFQKETQHLGQLRPWVASVGTRKNDWHISSFSNFMGSPTTYSATNSSGCANQTFSKGTHKHRLSNAQMAKLPVVELIIPSLYLVARAQIINNVHLAAARPANKAQVDNLIPPKASVFPDIEMNQTNKPPSFFVNPKHGLPPASLSTSSLNARK
ncbi:hypothetical protein CCUS01_12189 [Colletotrichum cuscutae]|uniref:Uncharacterized protein n=1 Tax=Colletotrichum cuscutae TaxID=1209917 RepID=A0AAI9XEM2_9PEZI|nr:hypothetical protein CCUS01_12189 [Colletotrichum cuscutae]